MTTKKACRSCEDCDPETGKCRHGLDAKECQHGRLGLVVEDHGSEESVGIRPSVLREARERGLTVPHRG